jgi:hypothetical protein
MEALSDLFAPIAGLPAIVGLVLTALVIFLTSDWRLSLTGLLVQYILIGLALTRFVRVEIAVVKILVGVLAVAILYLTARRFQEMSGPAEAEPGGWQFLGLHVGWDAGPLGFPLRLLTVLLVALAVVLVFDRFSPSFQPASGQALVPADVAFVAFWLVGLGLVGLVLSGDPLRVAPALLTVLSGFDLVYTSLESSLAVVGFWGAMTLLAALAFAYLIVGQGMSARLAGPGDEEGQP